MQRFQASQPRAYGAVTGRALMRNAPEDFRVDEMLGFAPTGDGEHLWVYIEKERLNTTDVALALAKLVGTRVRDVGYAGRKDRNARTRQWFSIYWPGKPAPDWRHLEVEKSGTARVMMSTRSQRKLQVGAHQANRFAIRLRDITSVGRTEIERRLCRVRDGGVPNYFGEQRFGRHQRNLQLAARWFEHGEEIRKRSMRGLVLSAARSWLFNQLLASRVQDSSWDVCLVGEWPNRGVTATAPTGPLFGAGASRTHGIPAALERHVADAYPEWCAALSRVGLKLQRRRLVCRPRSLRWHYDAAARVLDLDFCLPAGEFATTVLCELFELEDASQSALYDQ